MRPAHDRGALWPLLVALVGCGPELSTSCPWHAPCAFTPDGGAASTPSVLATNAFDTPWFEAWYARDDGAIQRVLSINAVTWETPTAAGLDGRSPTAAWDPVQGLLWLCRTLDDAVGCATSPDGAAWRELPPIPADRAVLIWVTEGEISVLSAVDEGGRERLHRARYDQRNRWDLDPVPLGWMPTGGWAIPLGDPWPSTWRLPTVDGLGVLTEEDGRWILTIHDTPATEVGRAGATWFGQLSVWEVMP